MDDMRLMLILLLFVTLLQGCANVAMSGASAVYNHHSIQKNINDQYITFQAYKKLDREKTLLKNANISIATFNRVMLLAGQVPEKWQRDKIALLVKDVPDVEDIHNLIMISNPSSALTRMSDAWITTKVKTKLIASNDVDGTEVKVITENGTVFLMGILQPSEAQAAVNLAKNTEGVSRVVKVFRYLRICQS